MPNVTVSLGPRSYDIVIHPGCLSDIGFRLHEMGLAHAVIISDRTVTRLYGHTVQESLTQQGLAHHVLTVDDGEPSKSLPVLSHIYDRLLALPVRRDTAVIALGGGVPGDLAGFAAATTLRGLPFIQIPTTLLAQVDSSVGGKTGINHTAGKNLIGSFYQPRLVWIDPHALQTLDARDRWAGLSEVVKYSLIADGSLFRLLETDLENLAALKDPKGLSDIIARCCRIKADIVARDETESGLRRLLNFGHTLGHALEKISDFGTLRHGEAVVYGMKWATRLSCQMELISTEQADRIQTLLNRFPLPELPELDEEKIIQAMASDKKQTSRGLVLVLLKDVGQAVERTVHDINSLQL